MFPHISLDVDDHGDSPNTSTTTEDVNEHYMYVTSSSPTLPHLLVLAPEALAT